MLKATALAIAAATILGTSVVSAQTIDLGRGGPNIDLRSNAQRDRDYRRDELRRDRDAERRDGARRDSTGSLRRGCREVTIRERDDDGNTVTRTKQDCR